MSRPPLETALTRWEDARRAGQDLSPAELLPDHPEMHDTLEHMLARMRAGGRGSNRLLTGALVAALILTILLGVVTATSFALLARQQAEAARDAEMAAREQAAVAAEMRAQAENARQFEEEARARAEEQLRRAERAVHAGRLALAQQEWAAGNRENAKRLLDEIAPPQRGWEWRLLANLAAKPARVLEGHTRAVTALAFAPDGARLASGGADGTVRFWDRNDKELLKIDAHTVAVVGLAYAPDGRTLLTVGDDGAAKVWDMTGRPVRTLAVPGASSVACSPDGKVIAVGARGMVLVLDATTGERQRELKCQAGAVIAVRFSPDGARLATAVVAGTLQLWDVRTWQVALELKGTALAFKPDASGLATTAEDAVGLWDARTGDKLLTLRAAARVSDMSFSPDGQRLACARSDGTIQFWDTTSGMDVLTLKGHAGAVRAIAFSPEGTTLASGGEDKTVRLWSGE